MKIIVVGGHGTMGQAVVKALSARHDVIIAGRTAGDVKVDISDAQSIEAMYQAIGSVDAVVSTAGQVHFGALADMTFKEYELGLHHKLMGQVQLVTIGTQYLNQGGSFTLVSGILNHDPIPYGASAAMVNGALEGFVVAAAIELPNALRLNLVSPTVLTESMPEYGDYFPGFMPVSAAEVAQAYRKSVEGKQSGQVYRVGY